MCFWQICLSRRPYVVVRDAGGWAVDATAIATIVLAVGVIVALIQIGEAKRTRHTEAAARMLSRWDTDEYIKTRCQIDLFSDRLELRDAVVLGLRERNPERHTLMKELAFFEELGAMEKLGAISLRWINETMKVLVLSRWDLWEPTITALAEDRPTEQGLYLNFRSLVDQLNGVSLTRRQRLSRWLIKRLSY